MFLCVALWCLGGRVYNPTHFHLSISCSWMVFCTNTLFHFFSWIVRGTVVPGKSGLEMVIGTEIIFLNNCSRSLSKGFVWNRDVRILRFRFWFPFQGPFWVSSSWAWAVVVREWWVVLRLVVREWLMTCGCVVRGCRECLVNLLWCSWMVCGFWNLWLVVCECFVAFGCVVRGSREWFLEFVVGGSHVVRGIWICGWWFVKRLMAFEYGSWAHKWLVEFIVIGLWLV